MCKHTDVHICMSILITDSDIIYFHDISYRVFRLALFGPEEIPQSTSTNIYIHICLSAAGVYMTACRLYKRPYFQQHKQYITPKESEIFHSINENQEESLSEEKNKRTKQNSHTILDRAVRARNTIRFTVLENNTVKGQLKKSVTRIYSVPVSYSPNIHRCSLFIHFASTAQIVSGQIIVHYGLLISLATASPLIPQIFDVQARGCKTKVPSSTKPMACVCRWDRLP